MSLAEEVLVYLRGLRENRRSTSIVLYSCASLVVWKQWCAPNRCARLFGAGSPVLVDQATSAAVFGFVTGFILFGLIPALMVRYRYGQRLADYGLAIDEPRKVAVSLSILLPTFFIVGYLASNDPGLAAEYPLNKSAGTSVPLFLFHASTYFLYYVGYEFMMRGFIQFGLRDRIGDTHAILAQMLASVLFHVDKPWAEALGCIPGSIIWGIDAFRTRSLVGTILSHATMGITLDAFLAFR